MIVNNVSVSIQNNKILNSVSFNLNQGDKVGLVGINGSGKSTLLKTLCGSIKPDSGTIDLMHETVGYLKQELSHTFDDFSIIDYVKLELGIEELELKMHDLEQNLTKSNMEEYGTVLSKYIAINGYTFDDDLKRIITGLKLNKKIDSKLKILSGGEKIKVLLATVLLQNSDILLLDEPTNNLDIEAIEWLEGYLKKSNKKMIIVSHDETFLNNIVNKIYELNDGKIIDYNMSYFNYLEVKENEYNNNYFKYAKAIEAKKKLQCQLKQAKEWADKGNTQKAYNDNDKIANNFAKEKTNNAIVSKIKKELSNINIPNFEAKKPINFFFSFDNDKGNRNIIIEDLVCGYENFQTPPINLAITFGQKLQINGDNGTGKTTFIKTIMNNIKPLAGAIKIGSDARIGYLSQDTLLVNNNDTVIAYLTKNKTDIDMSFVFTLLDKFNISFDDKDKKYSLLSPGQRTRVNLVKIALDKTNILILDEVTNHLDKEALDLIYEVVNSYNGTIISISHNRKYNEILKADMQLDMKTGNVYYRDVTETKLS